MDRVGYRARYASNGVEAPEWPAVHPLESLHPLRACAALRAGELSSRAVAAQRRLGVRLRLARPVRGAVWQPAAADFAAPVRTLADAAIAAAGAGWDGTTLLGSDGGLVLNSGGAAAVTTAGIAVAFGDAPHHVDSAISTGLRFDGHASSYACELVGLEAAGWVATRLRTVAAPAAKLVCI